MKKLLIYLLRFCILSIVFLPILTPYVKANIYNVMKEKVNVLVYNKIPEKIEQIELKKRLQNHFGKNIEVDYIEYGNHDNLIVQDYEDLFNKVNKSDKVTVILSKSNFFGEESARFTTILKQTPAYKEKRLYFLDENRLVHKNMENDYLVISSVFLPKTIFVDSETLAVVELIGKAKPNLSFKVNVELYNGRSFMNTKEVDIHVPQTGIIHETLEIPIQFFKVGAQSIIATITSYPSMTSPPLNTAFTIAQVAYSKTTILHVAFSPDWDLRLFRWKLKFWPNLDLLSYYILREINSDQSIRSNELSLIEFPSEKLFGSELANLHGIIAQNFIFGDYLGEQETQNLVNYIKNGGRLVIQAGANSFLDYNETIQQLYPCKNRPLFDVKNTYSWIANTDHFSLPPQYIRTLNHIVSHATFTKCIPKENTIILARAKETQDPVLIAMPFEKGIVVTFLASDWLSGYTSLYPANVIHNLSRIEYANASDSLFQWMVEFLQRKQDSGMRTPEFSGPRLYDEDKYAIVKSNGGLNLKQNLLIQNSSKESIFSSPFFLKNMNIEMLEMEKPFKKILNTAPYDSSQKLEDISINPLEQNEQLFKFKSVPIFAGSGKNLENKANPLLFEGVQLLDDPNLSFHKNEKTEGSFTKESPLLKSYPWLLALALGLLALEQFLSRFYL